MTNDLKWVATIATSAIDDEGVARSKAGPFRVALYRVEDQYFATAELCTHGEVSLADGYLEDGVIECPFHQGLFDVRTGAAVGPPCTVPLRTFPTRVVDGVIEVGLDSGEG